MKLLAIDTSSDACSVAVQVGEDILEKHVIEPREHTKILVPMIERRPLEGQKEEHQRAQERCLYRTRATVHQSSS